MLTSAQVAVTAFVTEYGEFICRADAHDLFDQGDGDGLRPVIQYELDEYVTETDRYLDDEDHVDGCGCTDGLQCDECATMLVEPWTDPDCEDKRDAEDE